jgi:hypothetical protein
MKLRISCLHQKFKVEGSYITTDGQSGSMSWCRADSGTCDQMLLPVGRLLSKIVVISEGHPLSSEDRCAVYSAITQWSESRRTRNHTLLSHLSLPPGGPGSRFYIPQELGGPVIPLGTGKHQKLLDSFNYCLYSSIYRPCA